MVFTEDEIFADLEAAAAFEELAADPIADNCPEYKKYCEDNARRLRANHE